METVKVILLFVGIIAAALFVIDGVNRARKRCLQTSGRLPPDGQGTDADVERLLVLGEKLAAIKLYREIHGVDLKEAKEGVESMSGRLPHGPR